ncbi:MAG TPA: ThiF family adenylyltransferase [Gaiellaceae bacterium]
MAGPFADSTMVTPRLKSLDCAAGEEALLLGLDPRMRIELADPTGQVRSLLLLLREGTRSPSELRAALAGRWPDVTQRDVDDALGFFDEVGWLEDAAAPRRLSDYERERYASNLAFFDAFTTLERGREEIQRELRDAHVVVLGAGGLGSSVLQNLTGLGVSRLTVLDFDRVELKNFARQFTYTEARIGEPKVHEVTAWLRAFDSRLDVTAVNARVEGPDDVRALLPGADLLVSAIDDPDEVDLWVNEACVGAGVPFVRGGLAYMQGLYWSVDPGRSACRQCLEAHRATLGEGVDRALVTWERVLQSERVNRGIGPVAQLVGSLVAMEALRYLTGIVEPVSAGTYRLVDFSGDCSTSADAWPRDPDCPVCSTAPARLREAA